MFSAMTDQDRVPYSATSRRMASSSSFDHTRLSTCVCHGAAVSAEGCHGLVGQSVRMGAGLSSQRP